MVINILNCIKKIDFEELNELIRFHSKTKRLYTKDFKANLEQINEESFAEESSLIKKYSENSKF